MNWTDIIAERRAAEAASSGDLSQYCPVKVRRWI